MATAEPEHTKKPKQRGKALEGAVFAIANGQEDISSLKNKIEQNGGRFSREINGNVAYVISSSAEVSKKVMMLPQLRQAIARRIPIVTESFINEACRTSRLPHNERFLLWHYGLDTVSHFNTVVSFFAKPLQA